VAQNADLNVYCGAAEVLARVALLDAENNEPGGAGWAQLRLRVPLPSLTIGGEALWYRGRGGTAGIIEPCSSRLETRRAATP
jgi:hypothetical protein